MSDGIVIKDQATFLGLFGPMEIAWKQTFQSGMDALGLNLVIVWHSEWLYPHHGLWTRLYEALKTFEEGKQVRILVIVFGDTPDAIGEDNDGNPLKVLLRALAEDADRVEKWRPGWASISDVANFKSAAVMWPKSKNSALARLAKVCAAISESPQNVDVQSVSLVQYFHFLSDPVRFRASILHGAEHPDKERRRLCSLKWLSTHAHVLSSMPLNVLVVENDPSGLCQKGREIGVRHRKEHPLLRGRGSPLRYLTGATFYVLQGSFPLLTSSSYRDVKAIRCKPGAWRAEKCLKNALEGDEIGIPWDDIDLVLQDVMLGDGALPATGLRLAPLYFDACPQALVFLLTGLDIESLVVAGDVNWRYVDAVIPKDGMESLWFEYRRCFLERFGQMFWHSWDRGRRVRERKLQRGLFGSLRKWQIEPDILWHGQNLPEMIDHAHRHITALWRFTNDFMGTLMENGGADRKVLSLRNRVAFATAVWMHDVGHRGDEYVSDSMDIRANHAGISERLLLRNPQAYTLDWLLDNEYVPKEECRRQDKVGRSARQECRNALKCKNGGAICLLREIGLLCRHHQSNAPLDEGSIWRMAVRGKVPSLYSLIPDQPASDGRPKIGAEDFLRDMADQTRPLPCPSGTRVRSLNQFQSADNRSLFCLAGLLRMLDALQVHGSRVGTSASIASFREFLDNRFAWCVTERRRLEDAMRTATPGTKAFLRALSDLDKLGEYEILLTTQHLHYWRQSVVYDQTVEWRWSQNGQATIEIGYLLAERSLANLKSIEGDLPSRTGCGKGLRLGYVLQNAKVTLPEGIIRHACGEEIAKWIQDVQEEVVLSEHASQYGKDSVDRRLPGYLSVLADDFIICRVVVRGTDRGRFEKGDIYVLL